MPDITFLGHDRTTGAGRQFAVGDTPASSDGANPNLQILGSASLSLLSLGSTLLGTIPSGKRGIPLALVFDLTALTGSITVPAAVSVGTNGPGYDNILAITTLASLTAQDKAISIPLTALMTPALSGLGIYAKVTTVATGIGLTTATCRADAVGYVR